jgi:lycopene cyclase-like protein
MVHPASGYQVGGALRRAGSVADAVAGALADPRAAPAEAAQAGWDVLWPVERRRKRALYLFGLESMMSFDVAETHAFFRTFFELPYPQWSGYLSDTLSVTGILRTMWTLFARAPLPVRRALLGSVVNGYPYLWRALRGATR